MLKITITTARTLSKKHLETIQKAVSQKYGKEVEYDLQVDPSALGGIKVVIGSRSIDMTVVGQLSQVEKQVLAKM